MKKILFFIQIIIPIFLVSWEQIGPPGIEIRDIKVDEATGSIYVLSFDYMKLYKVDEETNNWEEITLLHPTAEINSFDVFDDKIYLTKDNYIYITDNAGETWDMQYIMYGSYEVYIFKDNPNIILQRYMNFDLNQMGWLRSTDYGETWTDLGEMWADVVLYNEDYDTICLTGGSYQFYKSQDFGESWETLECPFFSMQYDVNSGIILDEDTYVVAGIQSSTNFYGTIYQTINGGNSWECINNGLQLAAWGNSIIEYNNQIIVASYLGASSHSTGLFKLNQDNMIWEEFGLGLERYLEGAEIYSHQDKLYWSTTNEGILIFEDNIIIDNLIPDNLYKKDIHSIGFTINEPTSIYTSFESLYIQDEASENWTRQDSAFFVNSIIQTEQIPPKWLASRKDGLYISDDSEVWNSSMEGIELNHRTNLSSLLKLDDVVLCYGVDQDSDDSFIYRSADFGQTWDLVLEGNESNNDTSIYLRNITKVDNIHNAVFYKKGLYRTTDLGLTWDPVFAFNQDHNYFDCFNTDEYFYMFTTRTSDYTNVLYRTTNFTDWINSSAEIGNDKGVVRIAFDPNNHSKLFAGVISLTADPSPQPHLMISEDSGDNWNEYYIEGLDPKVDIRKVYTNAETNMLYILPIDNSIMAVDLDEMNSADDMISVTETKLMNYPNPFNPSTTISFTLNNLQHENVQIEIFNIKGQLVDQLRITNYELGINKAVWNAEKFSSSVYFYKLVADGKEVDTKKMLLLK